MRADRAADRLPARRVAGDDLWRRPGGATFAPTFPKGPDACALASVEEVAGAYDEPIERAEALRSDTYWFCDYLAGGEVTVSIAYSRSDVAARFEAAAAGPGQAVEGIGDAAYWRTDGRALLFVRRGPTLIVIQAREASLEAASALAGIIVGRL